MNVYRGLYHVINENSDDKYKSMTIQNTWDVVDGVVHFRYLKKALNYSKTRQHRG